MLDLVRLIVLLVARHWREYTILTFTGMALPLLPGGWFKFLGLVVGLVAVVLVDWKRGPGDPPGSS